LRMRPRVHHEEISQRPLLRQIAIRYGRRHESVVESPSYSLHASARYINPAGEGERGDKLGEAYRRSFCASITLLAQKLPRMHPSRTPAMHLRRLTGRRAVPKLPLSLSLSLFLLFPRGRRRDGEVVGRTYARGLGFVRRIKNRHIGFTFPYLRDRKPLPLPPSLPSAPAGDPPSATTRRVAIAMAGGGGGREGGGGTDGRTDGRTRSWRREGRASEAARTRALINFGISYARLAASADARDARDFADSVTNSRSHQIRGITRG